MSDEKTRNEIAEMGPDEAAAILGDASYAYFDMACDCCKGDKEIQPEPLNPKDVITCPVCKGSGKYPMPPARRIIVAGYRLALHIVVGDLVEDALERQGWANLAAEAREQWCEDNPYQEDDGDR